MKLKSAIVLAFVSLAVYSSAAMATFDSYSEGYYNKTIVDGGITFSNLDQRLTGPYTPNFVIEDAHGDLTGMAGYSANNVLGFGGYVPGASTGFGRMGSFDFTAGFLASSAGLTVFAFGNDPGMSITLQGLRGGSVVGTSTAAVVPYFTIVPTNLSLAAGSYDAFRVVSSGPTNSGTTFITIDNVTVNPTPEPTTLVALGGACWALRRRIRRA